MGNVVEIIGQSLKFITQIANRVDIFGLKSRFSLSGLLEGQVHIAVEALADIAKNGKSEAARVSAACAILDRTHGRTRAAPLHGTPDDPLQDFTLGSWP